MTDAPRAEDNPDFETALRALEQIVQKLERGEATLEQSIALYEEGTKLKALCDSKLEAARSRIEKVRLDAGGNPVGTEPLEGA